jgi:hypothetical protein
MGKEGKVVDSIDKIEKRWVRIRVRLDVMD